MKFRREEEREEEKELQAEAAAASAGLGDLCCDEAAAPPEAAVWQDAAEE